MKRKWKNLPCRLGWDGIVQTHRVPMNSSEKEKMNESAMILKNFAKEALEA